MESILKTIRTERTELYKHWIVCQNNDTSFCKTVLDYVRYKNDLLMLVDYIWIPLIESDWLQLVVAVVPNPVLAASSPAHTAESHLDVVFCTQPPTNY